MVFSSLSALKYLSWDCERAARSPAPSVNVPVFDVVLHVVKKWLWCVLRVGVLCVRRSDSSPYQTCSSTPLSGLQSSTTIQHGNRNPASRYTQTHTEALEVRCQPAWQSG